MCWCGMKKSQMVFILMKTWSKGKGGGLEIERDKRKKIDFDLFLNGCELGCLFVAGLCVFETGGVA